MRSNILAILFTLASIVLVVLCIFLYVSSDRTEPEFRFAAMSLMYGTETTESDLLSGVTAFDSVDGDVTDRVVVEKVVLNEAKSAAVVYYAVSDLSGNVAKQSRVFPASPEVFSTEYEPGT